MATKAGGTGGDNGSCTRITLFGVIIFFICVAGMFYLLDVQEHQDNSLLKEKLQTQADTLATQQSQLLAKTQSLNDMEERLSKIIKEGCSSVSTAPQECPAPPECACGSAGDGADGSEPAECPPVPDCSQGQLARPDGSDGSCNLVFAIFYVQLVLGAAAKTPHLYTVNSIQLHHPGCEIVLLSDADTDNSMWEGMGLTVKRLDAARTEQMRETKELMLFRHMMELELLQEINNNPADERHAIFLDNDVMIIRPISDIFTREVALNNGTSSTDWNVAMSVRSGCPKKFRSRCVTQPINTGVKFVHGKHTAAAIPLWTMSMDQWTTEEGSASLHCPTHLLGVSRVQEFSEHQEKKMARRGRRNATADFLCDQAAFFNAIMSDPDQSAPLRATWGNWDGSEFAHKMMAQGRGPPPLFTKMNTPLVTYFVPCNQWNAILPGRHADNCVPKPHLTKIVHFKGREAKDKGNVLYAVMKHAHERFGPPPRRFSKHKIGYISTIFEALRLLKPED